MTDDVGVVEIFLLMLFSALFSFGGGSGQIPLIQGRWVETGKLPPELFSFSLAITYLAPGPRAGFLAGVGYYLAGLPGAGAAMLGILVPTVLGAGAVNAALGRMQRILRRLKPSSGFVIAGLIAAAAWGTARPLDLLPVEMLAVAAVAVAVAWRDVEPLKLVLAALSLGLLWSLVAG
ncbi:chromate transporter [Blastococcus capsensis]|uniref:chromate transporter n=1 Tax=Blastococcus capsensis TaxID=1564163 RepID=UPI00253FBFEC|nr:chromate transporter [Blastococcus capsensis]MDK3255412.1 chromate transporter [Blastococcus capsensis]